MITSIILYNISIVGYIIAFILCLFNLYINKLSLKNNILIIIAISFLSQTLSMGLRWIESGFIEILAYEQAQHIKLNGINWFIVFMQHPPWSNLYEIMIYMHWGLIFVLLLINVKLSIKGLNIIILILSLLIIFIVNFIDPDIKPLVPALKSWWLCIHVISASIAYSFGVIGSIFSFMYLCKNNNKHVIYQLYFGIMFISTIILFIIGSGFTLFKTCSYQVKLLSNHNNNLNIVYHIVNDKLYPVFVDVPYIGVFLLFIICLSFLISILLWYCYRNYITFNIIIKSLYIISHILLLILFIIMLSYNLFYTNITISSYKTSQLTLLGPYCLGFKSNFWDIALLFIIICIQVCMSLKIFYRSIFTSLPTDKIINKLAYISIVIAFILICIVLITGALWAHYAWGRYWGWDPKETGALIIWLIYAIYLHTKTSNYWSDTTSSIIGALSFFAIIAGFLGVNLGFFTNGLHSYGSQ